MRSAAILILLSVLSLAQLGFIPNQTAQVIRVGLYQNPPKIYLDKNGAPAGFWVDLVKEIAAREGYQIEWVTGAWEENLVRLESGGIDVLPDVGWSEERAEKFTFAGETVLTSWSRLYAPPGSEIQTILDLEGKRVAGLEGSVNFDGSEGIKDLTARFGVQCTFLAFKSYDEVFSALQTRQADAGITNKDFGDANEKKYGLARTPILIQPSTLTFAFPAGAEKTPGLKAAFDRQLNEMKANPTSVYYRSLDRYFGQGIEETFFEKIPAWLVQLLLATAAAILIAAGFIYVSRRQISAQTAELRLREERYRVLLENNPDNVYRLRDDGAILDYHISNRNKIPIPHEDLRGQKIQDIIVPEVKSQVLSAIKDSLESGELQTRELSFAIDNNEYDIEARLSRSGKEEVIANIRDVTSEKRAEMEARESEKRYQILASVAPVGIFHTDSQGSTTYVNPAWRHITGLSAEEALGDGWLKAVHPDDREELARRWVETARRKTSSFTDYRFIKPDGSIVWVMGQAVPELDQDGRMVSFVGTITDITERKKVEDLQMAVARAESADRLKSAFLATMSHELRTPLNSIIGFTGILLQKLVGPLESEQEKQLKIVQSSAYHLLALINDVLDISKIEAGQTIVTWDRFDVELAVQNSAEKVRPLAERKGLNLKIRVEPDHIPIISDQRRVEQILINLLNNAVKFTERGEVQLACSVEDGWLVTRVSDTGIGIREEDIPTLFKPFQQVDSGITRQYEGTGLGLSICQRLVTMLGGKIWVESQPGLGSTFTFTLPLEEEEL